MPAIESQGADMNIPDEFRYFVGCFITRSDEWVSTEEEWIAFAIRFSEIEKQIVIRNFVDELLASGADGAELTRIWASCGTSYSMSKDYIREFLTKIRNAIPVSGDRKIELQHKQT